jgi:hypothetical protein
MRRSLLATAFVAGVSLSAAAWAQTTTGVAPENGKAGSQIGDESGGQAPDRHAGQGSMNQATPSDQGTTGSQDTGNQDTGNQDTGNQTMNGQPGQGSSGSSDTTMQSGTSMKSGSAMTAHNPRSRQASNIDSADTRGKLAPQLPAPGVGPSATPEDYLRAAQKALRSNQSGRAQAALEMAETRVLDRSVAPSDANAPDQSPEVTAINQALQSLASRDYGSAQSSIKTALETGMQQMSAGAGMDGTTTNSGASMNSQMQNGQMKNGGMQNGQSMGTGNGTTKGPDGAADTGGPGGGLAGTSNSTGSGNSGNSGNAANPNGQ